MEVQVGDYRIARHEQSWVIQEKYVVKKGDNSGTVKWISPRYYHRLDQAVSNLLDRMVRTSEPVEDIKSLEERVVECQRELLEAVKKVEQVWLKDRSIYIP